MWLRVLFWAQRVGSVLGGIGANQNAYGAPSFLTCKTGTQSRQAILEATKRKYVGIGFVDVKIPVYTSDLTTLDLLLGPGQNHIY